MTAENQVDTHLAVFPLLRQGMDLYKIGQYERAAALYHQALEIAPMHPEALHLLGLVAAAHKNEERAIQLIEQSLHISPGNAVAWNNLGNAYRQKLRWGKALYCYEKAVSLRENYYGALANLGGAAQALGELSIAKKAYREAMNSPEIRDGCRVRALQAEFGLCDWSNATEVDQHLISTVSSGLFNIQTFPLLAMLDAPDLHLKSAFHYGMFNHPPDEHTSNFWDRTQNQKIRVGYFSADFHEHATAWLMADLIEQHNREEFEWHAFSFGPKQHDGMRSRLVKSFDQFHEVNENSDFDVAMLSRSIGIDIAVDLKGYTKDSRANIFAHRAAPVQVNYLGYPGTTGMPYIDYILADQTLITNSDYQWYSEKVARLPNCYQPNDSKRPSPAPPPSRAKYGLPDDVFVFCCFNNNYKITPWHFKHWVDILKKVPDSILWLYVAKTDAIENLRSELEAAGLNPSRLVFATNLQHDEHLRRYGCADLFLDTFPCNAHTTASDALWMGLPLVTLKGQSFASRVAASLLKACDMSELIADSPQAYVEKAVTLARDPVQLRAYKSHLQTKRHEFKLFDTASLASDIETAYRTMVQRHRSGLSPTHFDVPAR